MRMKKDIQEYHNKAKPRTRKRPFTQLSTGSASESVASVPLTQELHDIYYGMDDEEKQIISEITQHAISSVHMMKQDGVKTDNIRKILKTSNTAL